VAAATAADRQHAGVREPALRDALPINLEAAF
jgi:hypothetical protein